MPPTTNTKGSSYKKNDDFRRSIRLSKRKQKGFGPSSSTRSLDRIRTHPCPVQPTGSFLNGRKLLTSPDSFVGIMCSLWNSLGFPAAAYETKRKFELALESVDW
ncbi:hypothetical protein RvY_00778 [Ramazzottius varieornatus]|uniref:Uncharacterized protein n=1 Tax=Ramazzottius varieornatus TaxID=947166 RepID=A0A1D1UHZ3_RAMVA|nr:hypothetical protein RvY_00778 [Ramazzottius varieornatus]